MTPERPRILFLFVDGLGWGSGDGSTNPVHSGVCPNLERLLREHGIPVDASMGVEGVPQSATGQAALLAGIPAAALMGRHIEGFPPERLRSLLRESNLFLSLGKLGKSGTFANAYFVDEVEEVRLRRIQSVTTVVTLAAFGAVRDRAAMERGEAVYQDLTRASLRERGYRGPLVTPSESGRHLVRIAAAHDLTLFEYFQTDRAGHSGDRGCIEKVLSLFDEFLGTVLSLAAAGGMLVVLTSDHGNIEDPNGRGHTHNPVPFAAAGPGEAELRGRVRSITDVPAAILEWFSGRTDGA